MRPLFPLLFLATVISAASCHSNVSGKKNEAAHNPENVSADSATIDPIPQVSVSNLTQEQFAKMVAASEYVLVEFNASWCAPCQKMAPILEQIAIDRKDKLTLLKVDIDANKTLAVQKKIEGIPYMELYQDGELVWTHQGYINGDDLLKETKYGKLSIYYFGWKDILNGHKE